MKPLVVFNIFTAFVETLFFTGIVVGWPLLQVVLEQEGYFEYLCDFSNLNATQSNNTGSFGPNRSCGRRDASFNLVFTLAISILFVCSFPFGCLLDRFGTWFYRTIATTVFSLGFILLTVSSPSTSYLLYPGMVFIAVFGDSQFECNIQIANLAGYAKGIVISCFSGSFSSAAITFFLVKIGYDSGTDLQVIFLIMTCCTLFLWFRTFVLMPKMFIPFPAPPSVKYGYMEWACFRKSDEKPLAEHDSHANEVNQASTVNSSNGSNSTNGANGKTINVTSCSFVSCLKDKLFWSNLFHIAVISFRSTFFFGMMIEWIRSYEPRDVYTYAQVFGTMQLFSGLTAPLNGLLIDGVMKCYKGKVSDHKKLVFRGIFASNISSSTLGVLFSIATVIPHFYTTFVLQLFLASSGFGGSSTFLSMHFPVCHFGKLYGLTNLIIGLVSLLQYALFELALAADPHFKYINIGLLVVTCLTYIHPILIYRRW